jgi:hypothetical protein
MQDHIVKELVFLLLLIYFVIKKEEKGFNSSINSNLKNKMLHGDNKTYYFDCCVSSWSEVSMIKVIDILEILEIKI